MKNLTIILFILSIHQSSHAFKKLCVLDRENKILSQMAYEVDADCSWSISQVVKEKIYQACSLAPKHFDIRFKNGKLDFAVYSDNYDTKDEFFYCTNSGGYKAYTQQLTSLLRSEVWQNRNRRLSR